MSETQSGTPKPAPTDDPQTGSDAPDAGEKSDGRARTFEIRTVAIVGDPQLAVPGLAKTLLDAGINVRILCSDQSSELAATALRPQSDGVQVATLETVKGSPNVRADLERLFKDVEGAAFLSPVGIAGRSWRPDHHLADLKLVIEAAEEAHVAHFVYLSTVAVDPQSPARCLREAAEGERLIDKCRMTDYVFRAGPIMGRGDGLVSATVDESARSSPFICVWGYGETPVQPIHYLDLGRCIARAFLKQPTPLKRGVYAVAGKDAVSWLEMMDRALEKRRRFKLKLHVPYVFLKLAMLFSGTDGSLAERVRLLLSTFTLERNDAPQLLGPQQPLAGIAQTQDELLAASA